MALDYRDACGIRVETENGCQLLIIFTHACASCHDPIIELEGEAGAVCQFNHQGCQLVREGRAVEEVVNRTGGPRAAMLKDWLDRIEGKCDRAVCEIESALEVTRLVCGASASVPTVDIGRRQIEVLPKKKATSCRRSRASNLSSGVATTR